MRRCTPASIFHLDSTFKVDIINMIPPSISILRYRFCTILALASIVYFLCVSNSIAVLLDKVVAVVDNDIITLTELEKEAEQHYERVRATTPADNIDEAMALVRPEVLKGLIEKRLILLKAKASNIAINADEFNRAYEQMLKSNNLTKDQFIIQLEKSGMTEEFHKEMFKTQMIQAKLVNYDIRSKIVVTEDMILEYYNKEFVIRVDSDGYYLLQIGFSWQENGIQGDSKKSVSQDEAKQMAERVHKLAKNGNDFKELAQKFSDFPSAKDGGDIGLFQENEMFEEMRESVVSLPLNGVSEIIDTPAGFQFFQLISSQAGSVVTQAPYESVKEKIRDTLYKKQFDNLYNEWIKSMRENAYIEVL